MRNTNNLCADIGYMSLNHAGEQLCGDHVEILGQDENATVIVLADGLVTAAPSASTSTRRFDEPGRPDRHVRSKAGGRQRAYG